MKNVAWEGRKWLYSYRSNNSTTTVGPGEGGKNTLKPLPPLPPIQEQEQLRIKSIEETSITAASSSSILPSPLLLQLPTPLPSGPRTPKKFKFCSYNVTADFICTRMRHTVSRSWLLRRRTALLHEIDSYDADIVSLQSVDHFFDWWRPKLALMGYDTVEKKATERKGHRDDCVLVAYKRHKFQLFKTTVVELNKSALTTTDKNLTERCVTDDVGIIVLLQPFVPTKDYMDTAMCVTSVSFSDRDGDSDVRLHQCKYFMGEVEIANSNFQVPVLMGVSLYDDPSSDAYHLLATGRVPMIGTVPGDRPLPSLYINPTPYISTRHYKSTLHPVLTPASTTLDKCTITNLDATCRGSIRVFWTPPPRAKGKADVAIEKYIVAWRPGGSEEMGWSLQKEMTMPDCTQLVEVGVLYNTCCSISHLY